MLLSAIHVPFLKHFSSFIACKFECRICLRVRVCGVYGDTMKYSHIFQIPTILPESAALFRDEYEFHIRNHTQL